MLADGGTQQLVQPVVTHPPAAINSTPAGRACVETAVYPPETLEFVIQLMIKCSPRLTVILKGVVFLQPSQSEPICFYIVGLTGN